MTQQETSDSTSLSVGAWIFSPTHGESVRILDVQSVWGHTACQVWVPRKGTVERLPAEALAPQEAPRSGALDRIAYTVAAARIADALTQDMLLAPLEAGVIPLPHQLHALSRAMSGDRIRYLLADEVGLGKTVEAGLIYRELKLRGLVERVLVVAPKGLVTQWVQEMKTHFGEEFQLLSPGEFSLWRDLTGTENVWRHFDRVVCPLDAIKPVERRRGWSREKVEAHNQERLGDLIAAGWDLIICDEAHRLGGSTEQVARYRLGRALGEAAPFLLLLSATPHQGKTDSFQRLMSLLDRDEFYGPGSVRREEVARFVIRTEKRRAIDDRGEPLFLPRTTRLVPVSWQERHRLQQHLYESVTEYVRLGYDRAIRQNRQYLGFLMLLMQRMVTSSTRAIATALGRRLEALESTDVTRLDEPPPAEDDLGEEDAQQQLEELLSTRLAGLENEKEEVRLLLELARRCEAQAPDARAEALLEILYESQREENDPELKFLIFTEFVPTQEMLRGFLEDHGFTVACLNGSMDLDARRRVQRQFAEEARILVSTDAGGEGLNLQFAHVVVNFDLPWNPMRIEQRIGRVDRIGQKHPVRAFNLVFEESVELRVREVLEAKLRTILDEFGVDKAGDVLDSAESGALFERLYAQAILDPGGIEANVETLMREVRDQALQEQAGRSLYGEATLDPSLAQQLTGHPMPYWVERMTTAYLRAEGGSARKGLFGYELTWPDGDRMDPVTFVGREAQERGLAHVGLGDGRIRDLVRRMPRAVPGQPVPHVVLADLPGEIAGLWSLWRVALDPEGWREAKILPLFRHDDGRILLPTARMIWDRLMEDQRGFYLKGYLGDPDACAAFGLLRAEAERQGQPSFDELLARHRRRLERERDKGRYAFGVRREALGRIGLPEVRKFRLRKLDEEERAWEDELRRRERVLPELTPVIILRVEAGDG